mmetsp:Transcript_2747/g.7372  ORF Transcript_2747/g.7372 Transcript_2747/m.7372 type:complete len:107 (-) Transcript_2747:912-1232(-)
MSLIDNGNQSPIQGTRDQTDLWSKGFINRSTGPDRIESILQLTESTHSIAFAQKTMGRGKKLKKRARGKGRERRKTEYERRNNEPQHSTARHGTQHYNSVIAGMIM